VRPEEYAFPLLFMVAMIAVVVFSVVVSMR
jgi:hypothetical protein